MKIYLNNFEEINNNKQYIFCFSVLTSLIHVCCNVKNKQKTQSLFVLPPSSDAKVMKG